jgi:hypothetical protein
LRGEKGEQGEAGPAGTRIRRVECSSGGCADGCAPDEFVISAFCPANSFPEIEQDRKAHCSGGASPADPSEIICARK